MNANGKKILALNRTMCALGLSHAFTLSAALLFAGGAHGAPKASSKATTSGITSSKADPAAADFGSNADRSKVQGTNAKIDFKERTDDATKKKKQPLSAREKRESKGNRVNQAEIETIGLERALGGALDKEISYMDKLLPKLPKKSDQRPEILRRLVENMHQKSLLTFFNESRDYDAKWKKWDEGGRRGSEPTLVLGASKQWTSKVIQRAQQMITEYPKDRRVDEAYFQIAYALDQMGQNKEAASYYSQLVAKFPNSKRIPDSQYALGEFYFEKQDFKKALTAYTEVTRHTRSPIYPWAVYKIGWCYYNLQDFPNSRGQFQRVVSLSQSAQGLTSGGRIRLKEEALRDLVLVFAEMNDVDGAERYYSSAGGERYYGDMLLKLADVLRERGQYDESARILKKFVAKNPFNIRAAEIQIQIVDTASLKADKNLLWQEVTFLLSNFNPDSPWGKKNVADKEFKEITERIHLVAITYPKKMHAMAQKDKAKYFYGQAEIGYNLYLTYYSNRPEAAEIRFLLGEIQYQNSRYREAVRTFSGITAQKTRPPQFAKSAEYQLSSSYLVVEADMKKVRKKSAKLGEAPFQLSADMQQYVKTCDQYVVWFPKNKGVIDCDVDSAEIFLKYNQYPEAEKRLMAVAEKYPNRKEGKTAAELLLWMNAKDPKKLIALASKFSKVASYAEGDLGRRLAEIKQAYRFAEVADLEKSGQSEKAAAEYEKLAVENPKGGEVDKAWFNAGVNYRKANKPDKAVNAYTKVYTLFPKSPQSGDAILAIIDISESRLQLERAAQHSQIFIARFPQDKRSVTVSREACFYYEALNDVQKAQQVCGQIVAKGGQNGADAAKTLADIYERNNRHREFVQIVDTSVLKLARNPSEKIVYLAKASNAERKLGRVGAANQREAQIYSTFRASPKAVQGQALAEVGHIEFQKQAPVMQKFRATRLEARKSDGSDLGKSIETKQKLLVEVENAYKKVVATGDSEWGVAALYSIGYAYEVFAQDLANPPVPPGVPAADAAKLKETLRGIGKKLELKSAEYYKESANVVSKFGVYSEFSTKTALALSRLNPAENRKLEDWVPDVMFVGTQMMDAGKAKAVVRQLGGNSQ